MLEPRAFFILLLEKIRESQVWWNFRCMIWQELIDILWPMATLQIPYPLKFGKSCHTEMWLGHVPLSAHQRAKESRRIRTPQETKAQCTKRHWRRTWVCKCWKRRDGIQFKYPSTPATNHKPICLHDWILQLIPHLNPNPINPCNSSCTAQALMMAAVLISLHLRVPREKLSQSKRVSYSSRLLEVFSTMICNYPLQAVSQHQPQHFSSSIHWHPQLSSFWSEEKWRVRQVVSRGTGEADLNENDQWLYWDRTFCFACLPVPRSLNRLLNWTAPNICTSPCSQDSNCMEQNGNKLPRHIFSSQKILRRRNEQWLW